MWWKQLKFIASQIWKLESEIKVPTGLVPSESSKGKVCSRALCLGNVPSSWVFSFHLPSVCLPLCPNSPLYKHTSQTGLGLCVCVSLSHVRLSVTPWVLACQAPLSILEWVAIPFSRGSSQPKDWTGVSWIHGGVGSHSLLQGIFLTQGLEPRSPASQADSLPSEPQGTPPVRLQ